MRTWHRAAWLPLLVGAAAAFADDEPPADGPRLVIPEVRQVEALGGEHDKAFVLLGRVTLDVPGVFRVRAENVVLWLDPDADTTVFDLVGGARDAERGLPLWAVRGLYAEGGRVPAVFQAGGRIFRCSSLYYDLQAHRGILLSAELRVRRRAIQPPLPDLVLRAAEFRAKRPGEWRARDVAVTTSDYQDPRIQLEVRRAVFTDERTAEALGRLIVISRKDHRDGKGPTAAEVDAVLADLAASAGDVRGKHLRLDDVTARAFGVPFFRWRSVEGDGEDLVPLRVVADAGGRGRLGDGAYLGVGMKTRPVGWFLGGGYYDGRGPLVDSELTLDAGRVTGTTKASYIHDHGDDNGIVPPSRDRFWWQNRYRFEVDERWRIDGELTYLRDREWLLTYDEREFKEGKDQESLVYVRFRGERAFASLTGKVRTIGFQDEVEELPVFRATLPYLTLFALGDAATVQFAMDVSAGNYRHRQGDAPTDPTDVRTWRVDLDPTFFVAFDVGPVRVVPFATARFTGYDDDLGGEQVGRFAGSGGVRLDLQVGRWYGGVLHLMNVSVVYEDLFTLTEPPSRFFPLDDADRLTRWEGLTVQWRHRLRRRTPEGLRTFLTLELIGRWFPDREQPLGRTGDGALELDADWWATWSLLVLTRAEVDPERGRVDTGSIEGWWQARDDLWFGLGFRHLEGDSDIVTGSAEIEVGTRWRIVLFAQHDFKEDDSLDQGFLIQRLGRTAVVGIRAKFDPGDGGFSVSLKLDLLHSFRKKQRRRRNDARTEIGWR